MNLTLHTKTSSLYTNASQRARILTEKWVGNEIYCPSCGNQKITQYGNNKPVADFYCTKCKEDFELKAKNGKIAKVIPAGAYSKMIERINSDNKPNFFFMGYVESLSVNDFFVIPKHFFIPDIIEKRNPLKVTARRHGWVGANILFSKIPKAGQIYYVKDGVEILKKEVLEKWQKTVFLKEIIRMDTKGWILDIMHCIDALNKKEFSLKDMYNFESELEVIHPENRNIQPKIRQQLQLLRDQNYLEFLGNGHYRVK